MKYIRVLLTHKLPSFVLAAFCGFSFLWKVWKSGHATGHVTSAQISALLIDVVTHPASLLLLLVVFLHAAYFVLGAGAKSLTETERRRLLRGSLVCIGGFVFIVSGGAGMLLHLLLRD